MSENKPPFAGTAKFGELVQWFRENPPTRGTAGDGYDRGVRGQPNLAFPKGSVGAAAYRAGELNRREGKGPVRPDWSENRRGKNRCA